jgi:hypothetical protein
MEIVHLSKLLKEEKISTMNSSNNIELFNNLINPLRSWLESIEIKNQELAHLLCKLIPAYCPFERDIKLFERTMFHIPPMCKLNPLYEQVIEQNSGVRSQNSAMNSFRLVDE